MRNFVFYAFICLSYTACGKNQDDVVIEESAKQFPISGFVSEYLRYPDFNTQIKVVVAYEADTNIFRKQDFSTIEPFALLSTEQNQLVAEKQKEIRLQLTNLNFKNYKNFYNEGAPASATGGSYVKTTFFSQKGNITITMDTFNPATVPEPFMAFCDAIRNQKIF